MSLVLFLKGGCRTRKRQTAADRWAAMSPAEQRSILIDEFNAVARQMPGMDLSRMTNTQRQIAADYVRLVDELDKHGYAISFSQVEHVRAALEANECQD